MNVNVMTEDIENVAQLFRRCLGYEDNEVVFSFSELLKKLSRIDNLIVKQYDLPLTPIVTTTQQGFKIVIGNNNDAITNKEQLLHKIGHVLLDDDLSKHCDDLDKENNEKANIFTRCFLMPKRQFTNAVINNSDNNGFININKIAEIFNVNTYIAFERGKELLGWR